MAAPLADPERLVAILDFLVAAGIDCALDEVPHDRFAEGSRTRRDSPAAVETASRRREPSPQALSPNERSSDRGVGRDAAPTVPSVSRAHLHRAAAVAPEIAVADARQRAAGARDLAELEAIVAAFEGCALKASARQLAFADGTPGSRVMLVGEAPGGDEDRVGRPFVGRAGQLLDRMLGAIGLARDEVYIANVVPWRPPGNRTPTPQEIAICRPFIERQIELARPEILVSVGAPATQSLLGVKDGIFRTRGRWASYAGPGGPIRTLPMLHPAYLLRQPLHKGHAWRDLKTLRQALDEPKGSELDGRPGY